MKFSKIYPYFTTNKMQQLVADRQANRLNELIEQLKNGSAIQKERAASEIGSLGVAALAATDALVDALSDRERTQIVTADYSFGGYTCSYVRHAAVEALAKVNPKAAPSFALKVIEELKTEKVRFYAGLGIEAWHEYISFSEDTVEAFKNAIDIG